MLLFISLYFFRYFIRKTIIAKVGYLPVDTGLGQITISLIFKKKEKKKKIIPLVTSLFQ